MASERLPPQATLYQLGIGHYFSNALHVATKLGIADLLKDGPRRPEELAEATATHAPSLRRVLRLLASVRVFEEGDDGRFALTPLGECLRAGIPGSARAMVLLFSGDRVQDAWRELEYCVRTGNPMFRKRGLDDPFSDIGRTRKRPRTSTRPWRISPSSPPWQSRRRTISLRSERWSTSAEETARC